MSKLQALAAARKKKAQEQKLGGSSGVEEPMAGLKIGNGTSSGAAVEEKSSSEPAQKSGPRGFPIRKRKDLNPHEKAPRTPTKKSESETEDSAPEAPPLDQAEPSAFASTMFSSTSHAPSQQHFSMPYTATVAAPTADPFAGPSPDDVVIAAQSKGSTNSVRPQK